MRGAPPVLANLLLRLATGWGASADAVFEALEGDLLEEFRQRVHDGSPRPAFWYWMQVLCSLPSILQLRVRTFWRSSFLKAFGLGSATFAVLFLGGTAVAILVFRNGAFPGTWKLTVYLSILFVASGAASRVALLVGPRLPTGRMMATLGVSVVILLFLGSPEPEPWTAWLLWPGTTVSGAAWGFRH